MRSTALIIALSVFVMAACNSPTTTTGQVSATVLPVRQNAPDIGSGPSTLTGAFMMDGRPNQLAYLSLTQTGNAVSGYIVIVSPGEKGNTSSKNVNLQGSVDGDAITLSAGQLYNYSLVGRKRGDDLILTAPNTTGRVDTSVFTRTSQNKFNQVLEEWQRNLGSEYRAEVAIKATATAQAVEQRAAAASVAAAATAMADRQRAVASANRAMGNALSDLSDSVQELQKRTDFDDVLKRYPEIWTTMQADYQKEQQAASNPLPYCQHKINAESYYYKLQSDYFSNQSNDYALNSVNYSITNALDSVKRKMLNVQERQKELHDAVSANTTGTPSPKYTADDIASAVAAAQKQIDSSTSALSDARGKASSFDKQAAQLNETAKQFAANIKCTN